MPSLPTSSKRDHLLPDRSLAAIASSDLMARLPALLLAARHAASLMAFGGHGRRKVGQGDSFFQFRDWMPHEPARLIDWRRSARHDRHFVREREDEGAARLVLALDRGPGMLLPTDTQGALGKQDHAVLIALTLALSFAASGERIAALGQPFRRGAKVEQTLPLDLLASTFELEADTLRDIEGASLLILSDGYEPLERWHARLAIAAENGAQGVLAQIVTRVEATFPFEGRIDFESPQGSPPPRKLLGRSQSLRAAYLDAFAKHADGLRRACIATGFHHVMVRTDQPPAPVCTTIAHLLSDGRTMGRGGPS